MESLLKKEIKDRLNKAVEHELTAHSFYKNLANQMQAIGFFGAQKYFLKESESELGHYQILADYFNDRGDIAEIPGIAKQSDKARTLKEAFEFVYEIELSLGKFYETFLDEAEDKYKDCATGQFLLQFVEIQRKSVGEVKDILATLKIAGDNSAALLEIDENLGE
jgi:ferritin